MGCFIGANGYYVGDRINGDLEVPERPTALHDWVDGEWALDVARSKGERIAQLQSAYEGDLEKLNKAWLAALIADGAGEAARQAFLKQQMSDLEAQLDQDILAIIMEE